MSTRQERIIERLRRIILVREAMISLIALGLVVLFYFTSFQHKFLCADVLRTMFTAAPELGIIVIGVTLLMIAGEFDLSVGSVSGFSALIAVELYVLGLNPFLALAMVLGMSLAIGAVSGLIRVKSGVPSFIVTLGMLMLWRGVIYIVTAGSTLRYPVRQTHPAFHNLFTGEVAGIPVQFLWFILIAVVSALILNHHRFGNHIYATGGNVEAAKAMGVNTNRTKVICFMLVGVLSAFAGVLRASRVRGFYVQQGTGMELMAIAAAVVGGTSLFGGVGTTIGALIGVLVITFLEYGLIVSRVPGYWFRAILGILIILVAVVNWMVEKRRES